MEWLVYHDTLAHVSILELVNGHSGSDRGAALDLAGAGRNEAMAGHMSVYIAA